MMLVLLAIFVLVEVICLIYLYYKAFYRKATHFDILFVITFFIGFLSAVQFLSQLYLYGKIEGQHELTALFVIFSSVVPSLYVVPIAVVGNREKKRNDANETIK